MRIKERFQFIKSKTELLKKELENIGVQITESSGYILWHGQLKSNIEKLEYRNKNKDLIKLNSNKFSLSFNCKTNILNDKDPTIRDFYTVFICINGQVRRYRCKHFYPSEFYKAYIYSEDLRQVIKDLKNHIDSV